MNRLVCPALVAALLLGVARCGFAQAALTNKLPLHVLYAGHPGSGREADFVAFLKEHFREVSTTDAAQFTGHRMFDVVLVDYDGDGFKAPRPALPDAYTRPTVTLGVMGGLLCSQHRLKTGYM
ncbi:MAG: hypothetical protein ABSE16_09815 [Verrucomicrobiota bacterium]